MSESGSDADCESEQEKTLSFSVCVCVSVCLSLSLSLCISLYLHPLPIRYFILIHILSSHSQAANMNEVCVIFYNRFFLLPFSAIRHPDMSLFDSLRGCGRDDQCFIMGRLSVRRMMCAELKGSLLLSDSHTHKHNPEGQDDDDDEDDDDGISLSIDARSRDNMSIVCGCKDVDMWMSRLIHSLPLTLKKWRVDERESEKTREKKNVEMKQTEREREEETKQTRMWQREIESS